MNLKGKIIAIGDGYTDYELKREGVADTFIAYTEHIARDLVIKNADFVVCKNSPYEGAIAIAKQLLNS